MKNKQSYNIDLYEMEREARAMPLRDHKNIGCYPPYKPSELPCRHRWIEEGHYTCDIFNVKPDAGLYCCEACQNREVL